MNLAVVSLIVFFAVILFAAVTKKNCGVIALVAAYVFGIFVLKMKPAEIYAKGWPMGVFFIALSTTFLFAIANVHGTIEAMASVAMNDGKRSFVTSRPFAMPSAAQTTSVMISATPAGSDAFRIALARIIPPKAPIADSDRSILPPISRQPEPMARKPETTSDCRMFRKVDSCRKFVPTAFDQTLKITNIAISRHTSGNRWLLVSALSLLLEDSLFVICFFLL